ncbi:MAG: retron system putative HNH endonuclease [Fusobacteriaceae bacterium]
MLKIDKKNPPRELGAYRKDSESSYENMPADLKRELRESLLEEQGYLCAYCMTKLENNSMKTKIEHYIPQDSDITKELDYSNLLIVCKGNEGSKFEEQTCDTKKKNRLLTINPQKSEDIETIAYSSNGKIKSSNHNFDDELNKILNLNYSKGYLIGNRRESLEAIKAYLHKNPGTCSKNELRKLYEKFLTKKQDGSYAEYLGIILWYLKKKL